VFGWVPKISILLEKRNCISWHLNISNFLLLRTTLKLDFLCWLTHAQYVSRHRCRSRQIFGSCKGVLPDFPNLPKKCLCDFTCRFFPTEDHFSVWSLKKAFKGLHVFFCILWAPFFEILPGFLTNQNLRGCACTPCMPASRTLFLSFCLTTFYVILPVRTLISKIAFHWNIRNPLEI